MRAGVLVVSVIVAACGGRVHESSRVTEDAAPSGTEDAGSDAARTLAAACAEQVDVVCRDLERCGSFEERWRYASEAGCRAEHLAHCIRDGSLPGVVDGVAAADRCSERIRASACGSVERGHAWRLHCAGLGSQGTLLDGAKCVVHAQCIGGLCERSLGSELCGTCARAPAVGDPCAADFPDCRVIDAYGYDIGTLACDTTAKRCVDAPALRPAPGSIPLADLVHVCAVPPEYAPGWCSGATYCTYARRCDRARAVGDRCRGLPLECGWDAVCVHASPDDFGVCTPTADVCRSS